MGLVFVLCFTNVYFIVIYLTYLECFGVDWLFADQEFLYEELEIEDGDTAIAAYVDAESTDRFERQMDLVEEIAGDYWFQDSDFYNEDMDLYGECFYNDYYNQWEDQFLYKNILKSQLTDEKETSSLKHPSSLPIL